MSQTKIWNQTILRGNTTKAFSDIPFGFKFSMAYNDKYTNKSGVEVEETTFIDVTAPESFVSLKGITKEYLTKGAFVKVTGKLKQERWPDKETGKEQSKIVLVAALIEAGTAE